MYNDGDDNFDDLLCEHKTDVVGWYLVFAAAAEMMMTIYYVKTNMKNNVDFSAIVEIGLQINIDKHRWMNILQNHNT